MIGGYAQQSYGFNYYGTVGSNRDEFVIVRKMAKVDWLKARWPKETAAMKVRAQIGMVLNLDKCIGCHTCSVTCKNVWTSREGRRIRLVQQCRDQARHRLSEGIGRTRSAGTAAGRGKPTARSAAIGGKWRVLAKIFANPDMPEIDDYYEPFTFRLRPSAEGRRRCKAFPTARRAP
jgi:nitrate reductase beta subunit